MNNSGKSLPESRAAERHGMGIRNFFRVPDWRGPAAGICCMSLLQGCAIGPRYQRPAIDTPAHFRDATNTVSTETISNRLWWEVYKDKTLDCLIETALTNNYDLRIA